MKSKGAITPEAAVLDDLVVNQSSASVNAAADAEAVKWPRTKLIKWFGEVAASMGMPITHKIGWTAKITSSKKTHKLDPALRDVVELIDMHYPRLILRWRRIENQDGTPGPVYMRMSLLLHRASIELPEREGLRVLFDFGRSTPEPKPDPYNLGGKRYFHGSPHLVAEAFYDTGLSGKGRGEYVPAMELGRLRSRRQAWSTYFWVDFFDPSAVTKDVLAQAARWMADEARVCAQQMREYTQDPTLFDETDALIGRGVAKAIKRLAKTDPEASAETILPQARRLLRHLKPEHHRPIVLAGRWAWRNESAIEPLRALVKLRIKTDKIVAQKTKSTLFGLFKARMLAREIA